MNTNHLIKILGLLCLLPLLQSCVAAGACVATGAAVAFDRRAAGTIVDDQAIEIKATHALTRNATLWKKSHIKVISYNNVLLMVGQTPTEEMKREAEMVVSEIAKVRRIHNELSIAIPPLPVSTQTNDSWITAQIKAKILASNRLNPARVKVVTEDSIVYVMGLLSPEEQVVATDIARNIKGVEKVIQIYEKI